MHPRESMRSLPAPLQPLLTWVTGAPLAGETPLIRWTAPRAILLGLATIAMGLTLGAYALNPLTPTKLPVLALAWLVISGGMRRLDVVVVHQTLHNMVGRSPRSNRIIGEVITTLLWRVPYDENRREHLIHHAFPCSLRDVDTRYLLDTGFRPGMSHAAYRRYLVGMLLSPKHHIAFFWGRLRSSFTARTPHYRVAMSCSYVAATAGFLTATGLWAEWLTLWVLPLSFFFQNATFLYTHSEHRWWRFENRERLSPGERDALTFGRLCGDTTPEAGLPRAERTLAWARWWLRLLLVHLPYRLFVLVGDTVQHDLHHIRPTCDWPNSAYERVVDVNGQALRYSEVWGSVLDHLYAAGEVSDQPRTVSAR